MSSGGDEARVQLGGRRDGAADTGVLSHNNQRLERETMPRCPSPLHLAAVGHLLGGPGQDTELATLNFDTLLEQAISDEGRSARARTGTTAPDGDYVVHHLHGTIEPGSTSNVVLTLSDFTGLVGAAEPWQLTYLREAMSRGALVIAGTSYRDPDLRQWLSTIVADNSNSHAAIVMLAREGFALSRTDSKTCRAL